MLLRKIEAIRRDAEGNKRGGKKEGAWCLSQAEKERKEGTRQLIGPEARCCSAPSLAPSVCFPARIPQSEGLTGNHTGPSSQHLFPSQNTVGRVSDTWNEYFLPCPVPCLFVCFCLCFGLGGFIVCLFLSSLPWDYQNTSGFPFAHFYLGRVSPLWLNS